MNWNIEDHWRAESPRAMFARAELNAAREAIAVLAAFGEAGDDADRTWAARQIAEEQQRVVLMSRMIEEER